VIICFTTVSSNILLFDISTDITQIIVYQRDNSLVRYSVYYKNARLECVKEFAYLGLLLQSIMRDVVEHRED
jgi:hypothetical protein